MSEKFYQKVKTILVPVKGTPADDDVLRQASLIAKRYSSQVYLVKVLVVRQELPLDAELTEELEEAKKVLGAAARIIQEYGVEVETGILQARSAGVAIVEEATERNAELIMMAITYRNRLGEFNMGKTIPYVLKNAPCRVWMYREKLNQIGETK